jgi:hypothetical protein
MMVRRLSLPEEEGRYEGNVPRLVGGVRIHNKRSSRHSRTSFQYNAY